MPAFQEVLAFIYKVMNFPLFPIGQNATITFTSILVFITVIEKTLVISKDTTLKPAYLLP